MATASTTTAATAAASLTPTGSGGGGKATQSHHCHGPTLPRFPLTDSKRHCANTLVGAAAASGDNFGSYATLPTIEQQFLQPSSAYQPSSNAMRTTPLCSRHCGGATRQQQQPQQPHNHQQHPHSHPHHHHHHQHQQQQHNHLEAPKLVPPPPPPQRWCAANPNGCCCSGTMQYNGGAAAMLPHYTPQLCVCDNWYHQAPTAAAPLPPPPPVGRHKSLVNGGGNGGGGGGGVGIGGGCYFGYDGHGGSHVTDEEDSAFPALADREFHLLHRNIPALRRTGVDTTRIRQYFYPDGGWGWIICGVSFLVHVLTTGLQLSYGLLLYYAVHHLPNTSGVELLGALSWSISMLATPFVVSLCRKRSIRMLSIVGGLVMPLGILFTSFATEFGQVVFSYGIVFGIGVAMVREASTVMLGNYFKRRRQFVEMVAMSGEGVGIALFSVILKEGVGKAGWRLGLQIVAALTALSFFMGLMYRPASLYHPQRRAIQHLKNQRKKLREKKPIVQQDIESPTKYLFLDISSLKSVTVKILLMTSSVAAFGIYTPMFLMAFNAAKEDSDVQELVLLQTFLGISMAMGVVISGALLRRCFVIRRFVINSKIIAQVFISIVALAILFLSFVMGYKGLCILSWLYGLGLGGFQYSLKILALERVKLKHFSKAWGFIRGVQSVPVLVSVPLTSFLNDYSLKYGRAGYYICSAAAAISGIIIFFINEPHNSQHEQQQHHRGHLNGHLPQPLMRQSSSHHHHRRIPPDYPYEYPAPDLLSRSCMSLNQMEPYHGGNYCSRQAPAIVRSSCHHRHHPMLHHQSQFNCPPPTTTTMHDDERQQQEQQHYQIGQGSIGARMGKRLQRSLSFIQQHNCCDGQMYCSWHSTYELGCNKAPKPPLDMQQQPLICTCSPGSTYYGVNSRSRSVPEGLSTMSQQCNCRHGQPTPARDFIYVPHAYASLQRTPHRHHTQSTRVPGTPQCRLKRSQSLCRPVHFVEQITTSV